jgi:hypothetical protein
MQLKHLNWIVSPEDRRINRNHEASPVLERVYELAARRV